MKKKGGQTRGVEAALASALFLGVIPIFGKQAITALILAACRGGFSDHPRRWIASYNCSSFPETISFYLSGWSIGCALAGTLNGLGSLLYYFALERLSVSVGQLLYSLYPPFLVIWLLIDRQPPSSLTYWRIGFALLGVILLTVSSTVQVDWIGVLFMLGACDHLRNPLTHQSTGSLRYSGSDGNLIYAAGNERGCCTGLLAI